MAEKVVFNAGETVGKVWGDRRRFEKRGQLLFRAGLVGGRVDPNKLQDMPVLFRQTSLSLFAAAVVCGLLVFPVNRMMRGVPAADR